MLGYSQHTLSPRSKTTFPGPNMFAHAWMFLLLKQLGKPNKEIKQYESHRSQTCRARLFWLCTWKNLICKFPALSIKSFCLFVCFPQINGHNCKVAMVSMPLENFSFSTASPSDWVKISYSKITGREQKDHLLICLLEGRVESMLGHPDCLNVT